jgi:mono/diheme cytochrome c family protein
VIDAASERCFVGTRKRRAGSLFVVLPLWLAMFAAGCDAALPGKPNPKDRPVPPDRVLAFEALFSQNCAGCHGEMGKSGPAPSLNDPLFRAMVTEDDLQMVLYQGRPGTPMTSFAQGHGGMLTTAQIQVLICEIKGVRYRIDEKIENGKTTTEIVADKDGGAPFWGTVDPDRSLPTYEVPDSAGNAVEGARVFEFACATCHGRQGEGIEREGKVRNKIHDRAFLALVSNKALRRIIITGRPDLQMPDFRQKKGRPDDFKPLTAAQIADLGALLASWRDEKPVPAR